MKTALLFLLGVSATLGTAHADSAAVAQALDDTYLTRAEFMAFIDSVLGEQPPAPPDTLPPPPPPPPGDPDCPDYGQMLSTTNAVCVDSGWWTGFRTNTPSKLQDDGSNGERNSAAIGFKEALSLSESQSDAFVQAGHMRFSIKVNEAAMEPGTGGKHLFQISNDGTSLTAGRWHWNQTRVELAETNWKPNQQVRVIVHNYVNGEGGAHYVGAAPFTFTPGEWTEIDWQWWMTGSTLRMVINGKNFTHALLPGSEGPGRYWQPGWYQTQSGDARFWFTKPERR